MNKTNSNCEIPDIQSLEPRLTRIPFLYGSGRGRQSRTWEVRLLILDHTPDSPVSYREEDYLSELSSLALNILRSVLASKMGQAKFFLHRLWTKMTSLAMIRRLRGQLKSS